MTGKNNSSVALRFFYEPNIAWSNSPTCYTSNYNSRRTEDILHNIFSLFPFNLWMKSLYSLEILKTWIMFIHSMCTRYTGYASRGFNLAMAS